MVTGCRAFDAHERRWGRGQQRVLAGLEESGCRGLGRLQVPGSCSAQETCAHVGDLSCDESCRQVQLRRVPVGKTVLGVAEFDIRPVRAVEAAEELPVLLGENDINAVLQRLAEERSGQCGGRCADHLADTVERDGEELLVAAHDAEAGALGTQRCARLGDVDRRLQRGDARRCVGTGPGGGDLAQEVDALVKALDAGLAVVEFKVKAFEGFSCQRQDLLAFGVVGHGDREVVAVTQDSVTHAQQIAVEGVEIQVREGWRERTALMQTAPRPDATGRRTNAVTIDEPTDQVAQLGVGDDLA